LKHRVAGVYRQSAVQTGDMKGELLRRSRIKMTEFNMPFQLIRPQRDRRFFFLTMLVTVVMVMSVIVGVFRYFREGAACDKKRKQRCQKKGAY
jgi:hypothetical protein